MIRVRWPVSAAAPSACRSWSVSRSASIPRRREKAEQDQVLGEPVGPAVLGAAVSGAELGQRTPDRRLVDAAAVRVPVIEAPQAGGGDPPVLGLLRSADRGSGALARVRQVGEGRQQDRVRGRLSGGRPANHERDDVLATGRREDGRVDAAGQRGRKLELEARLPAEVVGGVGVKVHGVVLIAGETPIVDVAAPARAGDRPQGPVHAPAGEPVRAAVGDPAVAAGAERPGGDRASRSALAAADRRPAQLAVEQRPDRGARSLAAEQQRPGPRSRTVERGSGRGRPGRAARGFDRDRRRSRRPAPASLRPAPRRRSRAARARPPRPAGRRTRARTGAGRPSRARGRSRRPDPDSSSRPVPAWRPAGAPAVIQTQTSTARPSRGRSAGS